MNHLLRKAAVQVHRLSPMAAISLRNALPNGIRQYLSSIIRSPADDLADLLRGGYSQIAKIELDKMTAATELEYRDRANWWLAHWFYRSDEYEKALEHLQPIRSGFGANMTSKAILEIECRRALGQTELLTDLIRNAPLKNRTSHDFRLVCANFLKSSKPSSADEWYSLVNTIYQRWNLTPLAPIEHSSPPSLNNMGVGSFTQTQKHNSPLISVIMPVYRPGKELNYAIRSILQQTWKNIELILVDDASGSEFRSIFERIQKEDGRIRVIYQEKNTGAYCARNYGLRFCSGEYVTVHDADDWSHPQKLELQVAHLLRHPKVRVTATALARCKEDCTFVLPDNPNSDVIRMNFSSFMFYKNDLTKMGGWDAVRVSGDSELIRRFVQIHGQKSFQYIFPKVPLSFALAGDLSLTSSSRTSLDTLYHGVRHEYLEAAKWWHKSSPNTFLKLQSKKREFPAPGFILPTRKELRLDVALVMDARHPIHLYGLLKDMLGHAPLFRIGVFHWQLFPPNETPKLHRIHHSFRQYAAKGLISIISPGETVKTEALVGYDKGIFQNPIDRSPEFRTQKFFILADQMSEIAELLHAPLITSTPPTLASPQTIINKVFQTS